MNDFRNIWMPCADRFYRAAYYMLESEQDAEDAVQELYMKLWSARSGLDGIRNPMAYGLSLLKNICIDRIRRREVRKMLRPDVGIHASEPPPDKRMADKDLLKLILEEVDRLPQRQAEVMRLVVLEDLGYEDISKRTGLSQVHIRVLVSAARKTLKQKIRL